jgi:hypothetical protein
MAILLIAEHNNATLSDQTAKALSAALKIGSDIHVLVAGKGAKPAADAAAKLKGVSKVPGPRPTPNSTWPNRWQRSSSSSPAPTTRSSRRRLPRVRT